MIVKGTNEHYLNKKQNHMPISTLNITHFRNITSAQLSPCLEGLNVICGENGDGKTSLLEAIYYLGIGRSFRSSSTTRLVQQTQDKFSLYTQIINEAAVTVPLGMEREANGSVRMRMAEQDMTNMAEIAALLPLRLINSQSHHLFESGPVYRRKYLDWGLFYCADDFLSCWRLYERTLKQRNSALRDRLPKNELSVWTDELVKHGTMLDQLRREHVANLTPFIEEIAQELLGFSDIKIAYQSGWQENQDYARVLSDHYLEEYSLGYTAYGPHRADLEITKNGVLVKHFLSRGQQKLLICAMILAQGLMLARHRNTSLIYLVDDLPSELDRLSRQKLVNLLAKQKTQIFITAIESEAVCDLIDQCSVPIKVFHVKHGSINLRS